MAALSQLHRDGPISSDDPYHTLCTMFINFHLTPTLILAIFNNVDKLSNVISAFLLHFGVNNSNKRLFSNGYKKLYHGEVHEKQKGHCP